MEEDELRLDLDGWEGPLDLLLALARRQKVDLRRISILELVEQYLAFLAGAGALRLERAADYLLMAAWLAYLKSLLLLPREAQPDPDPEELAEHLRARLTHLEAMREAGAALMARPRLGRDTWLRGAPEGLRVDQLSQWRLDWFELVSAYAQLSARTAPALHVPRRRPVLTLEDALDRLAGLVGTLPDWTDLAELIPPAPEPELQRSAVASSFAAALELARQARVELQQRAAFAPLLLRAAAR